VSVLAGFADPVRDGQRLFRAILDAMAHPGRVVETTAPGAAPAPLDPASAAVCLTLLDVETPLWLDAAAATPEVHEYLRFHCGAPAAAGPGTASFALIADPAGLPPLDRFAQGTDERPERSTTVVVQVGALAGAAGGHRLTGPGIAGETRLHAAGLPAAFWRDLTDNHGRFPRGVDVLLTAGRRLAALPRTTRVGS
jgi:alpha-D-ribose 1-methylphosphonate 5-triphosphate synthase subunit PhnH